MEKSGLSLANQISDSFSTLLDAGFFFFYFFLFLKCRLDHKISLLKLCYMEY